MKKRPIIVTMAAGCLWLAGCRVPAPQDRVLGRVTDATMNTLTLVADGHDTLTFSTLHADRTRLEGLLVGDSVEVCFRGGYTPGMEADSLATVARAVADDYARFFEEGIRTERTDGTPQALYVLFSPDSLTATLFDPGRGTCEVLQRRTLPASGAHVWNVEDDDTKNLRHEDGGWTISQRGKRLFSQGKADCDPSLGAWQEERYEGILPAADGPGIRYRLAVRHRAHSGDGHFLLRLTCLEAEEGRDVTHTCLGRRFTQRGIPSDADAVVWQLVPDGGGEACLFLYEAGQQTLTLLGAGGERLSSGGADYTLRRVQEE